MLEGTTVVLPSNIYHATTGDCGNKMGDRNNDYVKYVTMITATLILLPSEWMSGHFVYLLQIRKCGALDQFFCKEQNVGQLEEQILEKTEMRMLRISKGVTLRDNVKSLDIRKELGVNSIQEKVREMSLRWYGHMQRMEENNEVRAVVDMIVSWKTPRGRPRGRWMDCIRRDMQALRITVEDAKDRTFWKSRTRATDPTQWEKAKKKKKKVLSIAGLNCPRW